MYIFTLVGDVKKVVELLRSRHGEFKLAMLYNSALDANGNWNFIVSSDWTDAIGMAAAIRSVAQALHENLSLSHRDSISRITVLRTDDPFVIDMTHLYPVPGGHGGIPLKQVTAGRITEGAGFVFYSQKEIPA